MFCMLYVSGCLPDEFYQFFNSKKNTALKIVNPILFILIINQLMTGFFRMKLSRDTFVVLHERGAIVLACVVVVHIILNFNWIKANYFHK